jgi:hypothetical protein
MRNASRAGARPGASLAPIVAALGLAACSYSYRNSAESLGPGEVGGRAVAGAQVLPGVAVSVRGSDLDVAGRASGRFALLPLPVGRHTLVLRKGKERVLQQDVEIAWGRDGQPEGVWLGDVELPAAAGVAGDAAVPDGTPLADDGIAVDELSGAIAMLSSGPTGSYAIDGLALGLHRIRVHATAAGGTAYVGGPADVALGPADSGTRRTLVSLALHPASNGPTDTASVSFRLAVVGDAPGLDPGAVQVTGLGQPVALQSNGFAQFDQPEGRWTLGIALPAGLAGVSPPPPVTFVAVAGDALDLGTLYAVADSARAKVALACHGDGDCSPGTCSAGSCVGWTPPTEAPASVPYCGDEAVGCSAGQPIGSDLPHAFTCLAATAGGTTGVACGACCTPDGIETLCAPPGAGGCP